MNWEAEEKEVHLVWHILPFLRARGCVGVLGWAEFSRAVIITQAGESSHFPGASFQFSST